jgi:hypothetical protein
MEGNAFSNKIQPDVAPAGSVVRGNEPCGAFDNGDRKQDSREMQANAAPHGRDCPASAIYRKAASYCADAASIPKREIRHCTTP